MFAESPPGTERGRLRPWLARNLAAIIAVVITLAVLCWKSHYEEDESASGLTIDLGQTDTFGSYGWPKPCLQQHEINLMFNDGPTSEIWYKLYNGSWPLCLDIAIALASLAIVWVTFKRTQRHCKRAWQFSLATLLAFTALAAIICAILPIRRF